MAEINVGRLAAKQLKQAGIDTAFGVVAGPMIEVMAGMQAEGIRSSTAATKNRPALPPPPGATSRRSPAWSSPAPAQA
jgi:hypothetical protein